jgi:hypothetical protein
MHVKEIPLKINLLHEINQRASGKATGERMELKMEKSEASPNGFWCHLRLCGAASGKKRNFHINLR